MYVKLACVTTSVNAESMCVGQLKRNSYDVLGQFNDLLDRSTPGVEGGEKTKTSSHQYAIRIEEQSIWREVVVIGNKNR